MTDTMYDPEALREQRQNDRNRTEQPPTTPPTIADCELCDTDGYRHTTGLVCDHQDHTEAARRGIAACKAALTKETHQ